MVEETKFVNIFTKKSSGFNLEMNDDTQSAARDVLNNGILVETDNGLVKISLKDALNQGVGGLILSEEDLQDVVTKLLQNEPKSMISVSGPSNSVSNISEEGGCQSARTSKIIRSIKSQVNKTETNLNKIPLTHISKRSNNIDSQLTTNVPVTKCSILKIVTPNITSDSSDTAVQLNYSSSAASPSNVKSIPIPTNTQVKVLHSPKSFTSRNNLNSVMLITKKNKGEFVNRKIDNKTPSRETQSNFIFKNVKLNNNVSVLNDDSELLLNNMTVKVEKYETDELWEDVETSDNSETAFNFTSTVVEGKHSTSQNKKRGGWPKGRKRKPELKSEIRPPKAPATGYVLFLNEKRKEYKDMPFTEVTKLLGNEWSKLSLHEKKVYLDQAEVEKKRYREELRVYRQSDAYQNYLNKKRLKRLQGNGTEESDMDATDEIDEEDNEELYCRLCDQWFHSLHNKKEHLYGRQHLQSIAGRNTREQLSEQDSGNPNMSSTSLDESSLDGCSFVSGKKESCCGKKLDCCQSESLAMDDAIVKFMTLNKEREEERNILKVKLEEVKAKNKILGDEFRKMNIRFNALNYLKDSEKNIHNDLEQQLYNLINVSIMFIPENFLEGGTENTVFQINKPFS